MQIFGFVLSVWAAIAIGLFFIAMVIGCTFDRHYKESPKWWILVIGIVSAIAWQWSNLTFSWGLLFSAAIWAPIGWYLLIGLGYSVLEFLLEVRRSARYWRITWADYKKSRSEGGPAKGYRSPNAIEEPEAQTTSAITDDFLSRHPRAFSYGKRVIGIDRAEGGGIEPKVNHQQLAESIGCWTFFWPFYLVSLIIGDLVTEIFNIAADFLASISGRFVRMAFKDVFKS